MIMIGDILVSDLIIDEHFVCDLSRCKGNCCQKGDYGAPVSNKEMRIIEENLDKIKPYLVEDALDLIESEGSFDTFGKYAFEGTRLMSDGSCVFMTRNENGIAQCGIEQANAELHFGFKKPISCHLYPIRVSKNVNTGFQALNYDEWDICSAACSLGKSLKVPVYKFVREALIRKYGQDFYDELDAAAINHKGL
jgi:hypothetical protein